MDFLACLPTPLPLLILTAIPDFETLHNIIHASPDAYRTFCESGQNIVEEVAANALDRDIHYFLRSTARIRWEGIPRSMMSLKEVEETYLLPRPSQSQHYHKPLPKNTPPHILLGLITTVVNIKKLTTIIIDELLLRLSTIKPMHATNRSISLSSNNYLPEPAGSTGWPEGELVPQSKLSRSISWIEGFRVERNLWILQVALDIRQHAQWLDPWRYSNDTAPLGSWLWTSISTIGTYVRDNVSVVRVLEQLNGIQKRPASSTPDMPPQYITLKRMPKFSDMASPVTPLKIARVPDNTQIGKAWGQDRCAANIPSDGGRIWWTLLCSRHLRLTPPMLRDLHELGLTIWDRQRLCDLGLIDEPDEIRGGPGGPEYLSRGRRCWMTGDEITYAWCSLAWNQVSES